MTDAKLKKTMLESARSRGLAEPIYAEKIDDYISLRKLCKLFDEDIKQRGVVVFDEKRGIEVANPSVGERVRCSRQMLAIYTALGYKEIAVKSKPIGDDLDDL